MGFKKKEKLPPEQVKLPDMPTLGEVLAGLDKMQEVLKIEPMTSEILQWHSTGIYVVDQALGGFGFPGGRFSEMSGLEGTGKTTTCLESVRIAQALGGCGIFIDLELGTNDKMAKDVAGVDIQRIIDAAGISQNPRAWRYIAPKTAEQALDYAERSIPALGTLAPVPAVLIIDSVPALIPQAEYRVSYADEAQMAGVSRLVTRFLRRNLRRLASAPNVVVLLVNHITTPFNQLKYERVSSGGRGMRYYPSVKLFLEKGENERRGDGEERFVDAREVRFHVWKNRCGPEQREVSVPFDLATDARNRPIGFDDGMACLDFLVAHKGIVNYGGGWDHLPGQEHESKFQLAVAAERYRTKPDFATAVRRLVKDTAARRWADRSGSSPPAASEEELLQLPAAHY